MSAFFYMRKCRNCLKLVNYSSYQHHLESCLKKPIYLKHNQNSRYRRNSFGKRNKGNYSHIKRQRRINSERDNRDVFSELFAQSKEKSSKLEKLKYKLKEQKIDTEIKIPTENEIYKKLEPKYNEDVCSFLVVPSGNENNFTDSEDNIPVLPSISKSKSIITTKDKNVNYYHDSFKKYRNDQYKRKIKESRKKSEKMKKVVISNKQKRIRKKKKSRRLNVKKNFFKTNFKNQKAVIEIEKHKFEMEWKRRELDLKKKLQAVQENEQIGYKLKEEKKLLKTRYKNKLKNIEKEKLVFSLPNEIKSIGMCSRLLYIYACDNNLWKNLVFVHFKMFMNKKKLLKFEQQALWDPLLYWKKKYYQLRKLRTASVNSLSNYEEEMKKEEEEKNGVELKPHTRVDLKNSFKEIDLDKDGLIDGLDLKRKMKNVGFNLHEKIAKKLIFAIDIDLDDKISYPEFQILFIQLKIKKKKITKNFDLYRVWNKVFDLLDISY